MSAFVGRRRELERLQELLTRLSAPGRDLPGVAVLMRGRRRVGKSRLVEIFCERSGQPYLVFQATRGIGTRAELDAFTEAVGQSTLPNRDLLSGVELSDWAAAFRQLNAVLPDTTPSVVVLDEFPWLMEADGAIEGILQTAWDRLLSRKPLLLILIGSDLAMMEQLDDYRRPFHQRGTPFHLGPLSPFDVGEILGLPAPEAFDAYLISGGLPLICQEWRRGASPNSFLRAALKSPASALLVSGERALTAEFPASAKAARVLATIGSGECTFSRISNRLAYLGEGISASTLTTTLRQLIDKRVVAGDIPVAVKSQPRLRRYRVADPYLRFYLAFLARNTDLIERGRDDLVRRSIEQQWTAWRGRAIEPIVREAILRLAPELGWQDLSVVGGWWNRENKPEIDLIGADGAVPKQFSFAGSIKWHEQRPFDRHDEAELRRDLAYVPGYGADTELVAVSRAGFREAGTDQALGPEDLIKAWR